MAKWSTNEEEWKIIPEFRDYEISNLGRVWNRIRDREVFPNPNNWGYLKVSFTPARLTRTVASLVAEAFVEPEDDLSDCVVILDGDFTNCRADNLVWRPRQFAWRYARQLKTQQPLHMRNLPVINTDTHVRYDSVIDCGIAEGMLFEDIWESTYLGRRPYPSHHRYRIVEEI
jgi:hypothetical protein